MEEETKTNIKTNKNNNEQKTKAIIIKTTTMKKIVRTKYNLITKIEMKIFQKLSFIFILPPLGLMHTRSLIFSAPKFQFSISNFQSSTFNL